MKPINVRTALTLALAVAAQALSACGKPEPPEKERPPEPQATHSELRDAIEPSRDS